MEAYKFWKLSWSFGSFDQFLNILRRQADTSNFENLANQMIRDKLVFTVAEKLKQVVLRENKLTFERAVEICQSYNTSNLHAR